MRQKLWLAALFCLVFLLGGCAGTEGTGREKTVVEVIGPGLAEEVKPALIRLEDIGPGGYYKNKEDLAKLRVIAEYLHQEGVPFHVSVIPRFVDPSSGYDVNIADQTEYAGEFVATIKYMQQMGAVLGIHGYTHQSGDTVSAVGYEFYDAVKNPVPPDTLEYSRDRVEKALNLFEKAGLTPSYWETPHYTASKTQYPAFEEQMGLIYENNYRNVYSIKTSILDYQGQGYRGYETVPTPLGYVNGENSTVKIVEETAHLKDDIISFFYHPYIEFDYISKTTDSNGKPVYVYNPESPLQKIVSALKNKGYTFVPIYALVNFVPAQRADMVQYGENIAVISGHFEKEDREALLVLDRKSGSWNIYGYTPRWYAPRKVNAFTIRGGDAGNWRPGINDRIMAGDINGDGLDDLIVYQQGKGSIMLVQNSEGGFGIRGTVSTGATLSSPVYLLVGDFNGDGLDDVALHDPEGGRLGVAINGKAGFGQMKWSSFGPAGKKGLQALAGDYNGDGKTDVALLDYRRGEISVWLADSAGNLYDTGVSWMYMRWLRGSWIPFSADINGDGKSDLLFYNSSGRWKMATSDGIRFVYRGDFGPWGGTRTGMVLPADLNGDGKSDLVVIDGKETTGFHIDTAISVMQ
ncbi:MAG: DUF2334 domain-containing protein [Bacillota bacterium]